MADSTRSPPLLRLVYLTLYLGLCVVGFEVSFPELREFALSLGAPFRFGDPPNPFSLSSALALVVLFVLVLVYARKGRAPRWLSGSVLLAFGVSVLASHFAPEARSPFDADRRILRAAESLHLTMNETLQKKGEITDQARDWAENLAGYNDRPVRRVFALQPLSVELLPPDAGALPAPIPGRIYVQVSSDKASYVLYPAGFDALGQPAYLAGPKGPVVLKGLFNPDRRAGGL